MITLSAPAKLNLTLEVLGRRPDGYHEIRSVIQAISLCDTISFAESDKISFQSLSPSFVPEKSLITKAALLLREATGCRKGATVTVTKRIPLVGGLGGDSSDAATVLRGLDSLWGLGMTQARLEELAGKLGSDVTFFLYGGTALMAGRGETITLLPPVHRAWVVLVMPPVPPIPDKTKQLYSSLTPAHYTDGKLTERLVRAIKAGKEVTPDLLFNVFEKVAYTRFPELGTARNIMLESGADNVHLAGSGPTLFTLAGEEGMAEELRGRLEKRGLEAVVAEG